MNLVRVLIKNISIYSFSTKAKPESENQKQIISYDEMMKGLL